MFRTIASILIAFAVLVAPVSGLQLPEITHITYAAASPLLVTADSVKHAPVKAKCSSGKEQQKKKSHVAPRHKSKHKAAHHHKTPHNHHHKVPHHKISHAHGPLGLTGPPGCG